ALRAPRGRDRPCPARTRRGAGGAAMNVAAQVASVVGCAGLVTLYLAPSRTARLAGLVAWAAGLGVLGYTLLPDLSWTKLAAAAVGGLGGAVVVPLLPRRGA